MPETPKQLDLPVMDDPSGSTGDPSALLAIRNAAHLLALRFTESAQLPKRLLNRGVSPPRKPNTGSKLEARFRASVATWEQLVTAMLDTMEQAQAWRFIRLQPEIRRSCLQVAECKDFRDWMDYMALRRDGQQCGNDELGCLAMLTVAIQRELKRQLGPDSPDGPAHQETQPR